MTISGSGSLKMGRVSLLGRSEMRKVREDEVSEEQGKANLPLAYPAQRRDGCVEDVTHQAGPRFLAQKMM
jgi:hypothetical protein